MTLGRLSLLRRARRIYANWARSAPGRPSGQTYALASILLVLVCGLHTTLFRAISQFTNRNHRKKAQPALLVGHEGLIEWLPRSGKLFKIGCSLGQGIRASIQKFDRIAVTHHFERATVSPLSRACRYIFQSG
jgi:hypothetical protein